MRRYIIVATAGVAVLLVVVGIIVRSRDDPAEVSGRAQLTDMQQSAAAMQQVGQVMVAHGEEMLKDGQGATDPELIAHGQHWVSDGQALIQGGQWMAMNPTAAGSLVTSPGQLADQGNWGELVRAAQAMLHDPSGAKEVDLEALRWNGEAMQAEGRNMAEHGQVMQEEVELMIERHGLTGQPAEDLRNAAQTMIEAGDQLQENGKEMVDYAERMRKSLGF